MDSTSQRLFEYGNKHQMVQAIGNMPLTPERKKTVAVSNFTYFNYNRIKYQSCRHLSISHPFAQRKHLPKANRTARSNFELPDFHPTTLLVTCLKEIRPAELFL